MKAPQRSKTRPTTEGRTRSASPPFAIPALRLALFALFFASGCTALRPSAAAPRATEWTLPAIFEDESFYVDAWIGTVGPLRLFLDTGATSLVLTPATAQRVRAAGFLTGSRRTKAWTSSGAVVPVESARAQSVQIGPWSTPRTPATVADFKEFAQLLGERVDGIAGMALFRSGTLVLDYAARQVRFQEGFSRPPTNASEIVVRYRYHIPHAELQIGGLRLAAIVDSGFNGGLQLPDHNCDLAFVSSPVLSAATVALDGVTSCHHARLATNIHWGGKTIVQPVVQTCARGPNLIGTRVLREFQVGLDQKQRRLWVVPHTDSPLFFPPWRSLGLALLPSDRGLEVKAIIPNTDAARLDIHVGDIVTAINGEPARAWPHARLTRLRQTDDALTIEIEHGGKSQSLRLRIATLVP